MARLSMALVAAALAAAGGAQAHHGWTSYSEAEGGVSGVVESADLGAPRSRDGLELNRAFVRIADLKARRAIVELVRTLANEPQPEPAT